MLYANDRVVGQAASAPTTFQFQPTVDNVNKTTLVAVVTDRSGVSTTKVKLILVRWFRARAFRGKTVQLSREGGLYRVRTSGRLIRPAALGPTEGCTSDVRLTYRWKGGSTQALTGMRSKRCTFTSPSVYLPKGGVVRVRAEYLGDGALEYTRTSHRIRVR